MKTSYFRRRNSGLLGGSRLALGICALVLLILLILRFAWPAGFTALFSPLWSLGSFFAERTHDATSAFRNAAALSAQVDTLRAENEALALENRVLTERLADLDALATTSDAADHPAGILVRPPVAGYDTLIVSLASGAPGVGALAIAPGNVPIGTLTETYGTTGRVALYSSSGRMTDAWLGPDRTPLVLIGRGAGAFRAEVPRETPVAVGDGVYLPGPGALLAGIVERVDADPASPSSVLFIRPAVNVFSLPWIILRPLP